MVKYCTGTIFFLYAIFSASATPIRVRDGESPVITRRQVSSEFTSRVAVVTNNSPYHNEIDTAEDPFLITGNTAKTMASYLYSKLLFFGDIPHVRALLVNQEIRTMNGLSGNRFGSLNPNSPWFRFMRNS